jgi:hypothetical protein
VINVPEITAAFVSGNRRDVQRAIENVKAALNDVRENLNSDDKVQIRQLLRTAQQDGLRDLDLGPSTEANEVRDYLQFEIKAILEAL